MLIHLRMQERPRIGVGVIVVKDGKVLLGKRKNAHGEGCWSFPGGHLELNEELEECAAREVMEETGISIKNLRKAAFTNDIFKKEQKHYVTLFIVSDFVSGEALVKEPDKCERWEWFDWDKFPEPLFIPIRNLLKQGYSPFG
jgi:8-oxo-dGTP diphosphatase